MKVGDEIMRDIQHKKSLHDEIDDYIAAKNIEFINAFRTDATLREFMNMMANGSYKDQLSSQSNS